MRTTVVLIAEHFRGLFLSSQISFWHYTFKNTLSNLKVILTLNHLLWVEKKTIVHFAIQDFLQNQI